MSTSSRSLSTGGGSQDGYAILVGREEPLEQLRQAHRASVDGASVLAYVRGRSGMGKSSTVRVFIEELQAGDREVVVLRGRCYERESVPFKAVDTLIEALASYLMKLPPLDVEGLMPRDAQALARVFPVLRQIEAVTAERRRALASPDPQELQRCAFAALRELLTRIADRSAVILAIDDLQWGDVDSARLLATLLRPPDAPALLLLACYRSEDVDSSEFLREFRHRTAEPDLDVREIELTGLSESAALNLALIHLGDGMRGRAVAKRIVKEANGSPFFIEELTRYVRDDNEREDTTPVSLREVLQARILRLPAKASELLAAVAVAGRPISEQLAFRVVGSDDPATLALLKAGSFVRTRTASDRTRYMESYHDRVRETAVWMLSPDQLEALHQRFALVVEASPNPDPEVLASHLLGAGDRARAGEFAVIAARRAAESLAFDRAARLYRMALDLEQGGATGRRLLLVSLGEALVNAGRGPEAATAFLDAASGAGRSESLELRRRAADQLMRSGHVERGITVLESVLAALDMRLSPSPRRALLNLVATRLKLGLRGLGFNEKEEREIPASQLLKIDVTNSVATTLGMVDHIRGGDFQQRNLLLALRAGEPKRVAKALCIEASFLSYKGASAAEAAGRVLAAASQLVERLGDPYLHGLLPLTRAIIALQSGRWRESYEQGLEAEAIFRERCTGVRWELTMSQLFVMFAISLIGELREVRHRLPMLLKEADEVGDLHCATSLRATLSWSIALADDEPARARTEIERAMTAFAPPVFTVQSGWAVNARSCIDIYEGNGELAFERCERCWPEIEKSLLLRLQNFRIYMLDVRGRSALAAACKHGDARAARVAEHVALALMKEGLFYTSAGASVIPDLLTYPLRRSV